MALFDKFKKSTEDAKNKIDKAKAQITQTRDNIINKAGSTVLGMRTHDLTLLKRC